MSSTAGLFIRQKAEIDHFVPASTATVAFEGFWHVQAGRLLRLEAVGNVGPTGGFVAGHTYVTVREDGFIGFDLPIKFHTPDIPEVLETVLKIKIVVGSETIIWGELGLKVRCALAKRTMSSGSYEPIYHPTKQTDEDAVIGMRKKLGELVQEVERIRGQRESLNLVLGTLQSVDQQMRAVQLEKEKLFEQLASKTKESMQLEDGLVKMINELLDDMTGYRKQTFNETKEKFNKNA